MSSLKSLTNGQSGDRPLDFMTVMQNGHLSEMHIPDDLTIKEKFVCYAKKELFYVWLLFAPVLHLFLGWDSSEKAIRSDIDFLFSNRNCGVTVFFTLSLLFVAVARIVLFKWGVL